MKMRKRNSKEKKVDEEKNKKEDIVEKTNDDVRVMVTGGNKEGVKVNSEVGVHNSGMHADVEHDVDGEEMDNTTSEDGSPSVEAEDERNHELQDSEYESDFSSDEEVDEVEFEPDDDRIIWVTAPCGDVYRVDSHVERPDTFESEKAEERWDMATQINIIRMKSDVECGECTPEVPPYRRAHERATELPRRNLNEYERSVKFRKVQEAAHPDPNVVTRDSKVTCCYDFLKDRCYRERCKYFHPPAHIKERLVAAGKQYGAMMSNMYCVAASGGGGIYPAALSLSAVQHPVMGFDGCLVASPPPPPTGLSPAFVLSPFGALTERLHICPEFARGQCSVEMCPFAHPEFHVRQNFDSTVTMCRDFIRTGCQREHCRYFHPPQHIMAQVESIINMHPMGPPQGMFIAHSPLMSPPTSFQPGPALMYSAPHPSFSLSSPIPTSSVPFYPAPAAPTPAAAAVPISVISTHRPVGGVSTVPAAARGYSHHFPMTSVVSVQSMSTQPTSYVQPPILSPISADAVSGHQVGAPQMPNLAIA